MTVLAPGVEVDGAVVRKRVGPGWAPLPVDHPNVLAVLAVADGVAVLPHVPGGSLAGLVDRRGGLATGEVVAVGARLADALAAVHAAGAVHRDVSPGNVLLAADGEPLLADPSRPGRGTPGFVAPEVLAGRPAGPAADVFALAATCRAALGGGVSRLPAALAAALHPDPERRPTAADLAAALCREGPGRLPVPPDDAVPAAGPITVDLPDRPPAPPTARPVRRPGALAAAAAVGALVAAGTVAAWSAGRATAAPEPVAFDPATGVVTTATGRFRVGRPGDAFLVGDWDGDGRPTPALYRPSTGEVLTFTDWPPAAPAAPAEVARAARGGTARVVADGGRDRVEVTPPEDRA